MITIISVILLIIAVFIFALSYLIFCQLFKRTDKQTDESNLPEPWKSMFAHLRSEEAWFFSLPYKCLHINSDGYDLNGYYLSQKSNKTVLLIHGYRDDAISRMTDVRLYYELGYNIFLPDARSHGKSQGKYIGMGSVDRKDIFQWIDQLNKTETNQCKFVLDGVSMGGATVLALSGDNDLPKSVTAIISDSAFTSVAELIPHHIKIKPPAMAHILIFFVELWCKILAHYGFSDATPIQQIAKSSTPVLIIYGTQDNFVPYEMSVKLSAACPAPTSVLAVDGAAHGMAAWVAKSLYEEKIKAFLAEHMG